jgi:hypothetical protein
MATDRDEQLRQQQELEEIRRSFAEMGARMGSLFEPTETEEPQRSLQAPPAQSAAAPARPRWWWLGLALLFIAGTAVGWTLPRGGDANPAPPRQAAPATTQPPSAQSSTTTAPPPRTRVSVPEPCVETADLGDEVISRLTRNVRDQRLFLALRDYTIASQACRREASP